MRNAILTAALALVACSAGSDDDDDYDDWGNFPMRLQVALLGPSGLGHVASRPPGIDCPDRCTMEAAQRVELTATPSTAANFRGWSGDCVPSGFDPRVAFVPFRHPQQEARCSVSFATKTTDIDLTVVGPGRAQINTRICRSFNTCRSSFPSGTTVRLLASPDDGAAFVGWTGAVTSSAETLSYTLPPSTSSVTATFR